MHAPGHIGAALVMYVPVATVVVSFGFPRLAAYGMALSVAVSTLPDVDQKLPIAHRGFTHTVWFLFALALLGAGTGWILGSSPGDPFAYASVFGATVGVSILSHLLVDSITPMGIRPFTPLLEFHHSFELVRAANDRANIVLFGLGSIAALFCYVILL